MPPKLKNSHPTNKKYLNDINLSKKGEMINQLKTVFLLGILTGILLVIGSFFGSSGLTIALLLAIIMNFGSYFFSHKIILMMYRAKETTKSQQPELHELVEDIVKDMNIPKPKIYTIPTSHLNAFATGPNPKNAVVAFTEGILHKLSRKELKGVAAHELAHIKNRDILISTIAATIAAVISYVAFITRWAALFGGMGRDRDSGNIFHLLILAIIAPLAAMIVQLAISRSREYIADATGAKTIKDAEALASALEKIHAGTNINPLRRGLPATSSIFIINPFHGSTLINLFSTHPPIEKRLEKLRSLKI